LFKSRIKVISTIASHSPLNISETVKDRGLVPKTTNRKWPTGCQMVTWSMTSRDVMLMIPIRLERNISKTAGDAIF